MSDGFERSTEFLPWRSRESKLPAKMETIDSIEGRARGRRCLTTAREKELMVRFRRQRHASHFLGILRWSLHRWARSAISARERDDPSQ